MKKCASCVAPFDADEDWKTLCPACYRRSKTATLPRVCAMCGDSFQSRGPRHTLCRDCYSYSKKEELEKIVAERDWAMDTIGVLRRELAKKAMELSHRPIDRVIPLEQWRRLVQLCHPDRHGGSDAATNATRWLLENRPEESP